MSTEKIIVATDLEDFDEVDVIEILVSEGETVEVNQSIVTLESDKAMMEFPASSAGTVKSISVSVGDKIKQGDPLLTLSIENEVEEAIEVQKESPPQIKPTEPESSKLSQSEKPIEKSKDSSQKTIIETDKAYASPSVRKYAKEVGVNLDNVKGSAEQGRISKHDVQTHIKGRLSSGQSHPQSVAKTTLPDFGEYGEVQIHKLNKLKQVSANHLWHAWNVAPHVTQFDDADITELEKTRKQLKSSIEEQGAKLTLLPFIMKALVKCLNEFPDFNSSINEDGTALIHKKYFNIGIAVDTPRGLVVPNIREVEQKKIPTLARELLEVSERARENKITPKEMQGGCMTITSLGGIGGQHFTPIINYPEVAILGVSRTQTKLVKEGDEIVERLMLPLSLSYDHRAIDGVAAVKFITSLRGKLSDPWSLMI